MLLANAGLKYNDVRIKIGGLDKSCECTKQHGFLKMEVHNFQLSGVV